MKKSLADERYASGRKRPPSRTIATSSGVNRQFHKVGLKYFGSVKKTVKKYRALRGLKQVGFPTLVSWTELKCKKYLESKGFFGKRKSRKCWRCRSSLVNLENSSGYMRCGNAKCQAFRPSLLPLMLVAMFLFFLRLQKRVDVCYLTHPGLRAYTPFMNQVKAGQDPDMQGFIRGLYCFGTKIPQDSAAHMIGRSHDFVDNLYKQARFVTFEPGILEIDSCRTATQKKKWTRNISKLKPKRLWNGQHMRVAWRNLGPKCKFMVGDFWWLSVGKENKVLSFLYLIDPRHPVHPDRRRRSRKCYPFWKTKWIENGTFSVVMLPKVWKVLENTWKLKLQQLDIAWVNIPHFKNSKPNPCRTKLWRAWVSKPLKKREANCWWLVGTKLLNPTRPIWKNSCAVITSCQVWVWKPLMSTLYVHSNLGLECVLDAYASYMQKMLDQLNPNKMFQNVDWLKPPALWEQKWKSSPTRTPGRVARRTQFFEKLNPKKSTIKMLVAEVKPCNHVVAWHIHLVKIHTSLQRKRNFEENNRLKEHDFSYQQRCMSSWMQLELGQTPPVNPTCWHHLWYHHGNHC